MTFAYAGIDHVQIAAPRGCEEQARVFYAGKLGMTELPKPPELQKRGGVWFQCGNHQLHVGVQDDFVPARKAHPAFAVTGLRRLKEILLGHGIGVLDDDARQEEGVERFYVSDPFGNRLEFLEWA